MMDNQACGCGIALILLLSIPLCFIVSAVGFVQGIAFESQISNSQRLYLHKIEIDETNSEVNIAIPSKIVPGDPARSLVWACSNGSVSGRTPLNHSLPITLTSFVEPPLFIDETDSATFNVNTDEINCEDPVELSYRSEDIYTGERTTPFRYIIQTNDPTIKRSFEVERPIDSEAVKKRIAANRMWQIVGMIVTFAAAIGAALIATTQ